MKLLEKIRFWWFSLRIRGLVFHVEVTHADTHFIVAVSASKKNCRRLDRVPHLADHACEDTLAWAKQQDMANGETLTRTFTLKGVDQHEA